jgi:hypothetical protein
MRRLVVLVALALFAGASVSSVTWAKPARHRKVKRKRSTPPPAPDRAAGSAAGSGPMPGAGAAPNGAASPAAPPTTPVTARVPDPATAPATPGAAPAAPGVAPAPAPARSPDTTAAWGADGPSAELPPPSASVPARRPTLAMRGKPHGGFIDDLDCSACHTADGWSLTASAGASGFDHDRTGFPLRGAHVQTTCSRCHTGQGKPATTCAGCHRDPHQGRNEGTCADCHDAVAWSDTSALERHRLTRMPLTGRHATAACSACHVRTPERMTSDLPTDCYACHRDQYHRTDVHPTHDGSDGRAPFPRDCGLCHQTSAWTPAVTDPSSLPRNALRTAGHDAYFVLTTGSHRTAECTACHADARRARLVRCDGCHHELALRDQHRRPVARAAAGCLRCHPRGAAR